MISINDIPQGVYRDWLIRAGAFLNVTWGLNGDFGLKIALLILYSHFASNSGSLLSGFRNPQRQKELQELWDAGIRTGLAVRPATNSRHSLMTFGQPDSLAMDISFSNPSLAGRYAPIFGLKWGGDFRTPDIPHFFIK